MKKCTHDETKKITQYYLHITGLNWIKYLSSVTSKN